jgi:hypothetical protein
MFGTFVVGMAVATILVIVLHFLASLATRGKTVKPMARGLGTIGSLVYLVMLLCILLLAVTSLRGIFVDGHMRGWLLLVHMSASGGFVVTVLMAVLLWAAASEVGTSGSGSPPTGKRFLRITRWSFWIFIASSLVSLGTMLLSMFPLLDTAMMEWMLDVHRYAGLVIVGSIVVHLYSVSLARIVVGSQQAPASTPA